MGHWLFNPPVTFVIILFTLWFVFLLLSRLAMRPVSHTKGKRDAYACGEENFNNSAQPDYSNFFPYAFFFTLAHVATLIITTVPLQTLQSFVMAGLYLIGAIAGLIILFRR